MQRLEAMHDRSGSREKQTATEFYVQNAYAFGMNICDKEGKNTRRNRRSQVVMQVTPADPLVALQLKWLVRIVTYWTEITRLLYPHINQSLEVNHTKKGYDLP